MPDPADTLVVADGFSCRSQIEQTGTGRRALHLGQVLVIAGRYGPAGSPGPYPERTAEERPQAGGRHRTFRAVASIGVAVATGAAFVHSRSR